jgi:hypothetical protein
MCHVKKTHVPWKHRSRNRSVRRRRVKLALAENVTTGTIHKAFAEDFSEEYACRHIFSGTEDSGHGGVRRYRGWFFGYDLMCSIDSTMYIHTDYQI